MADLRINESLWDAVAETDRGKIVDIMRKSRLLSGEASIVPSADQALPPEGGNSPSAEAGFCKIACDAAEAAAIEACNDLSGAAKAACIAIAQAAGEECRNNC